MKKSNGAAPQIPKAVMDHWDQMVAAMQTPQHKAAVDALFRMTSKELGEAAVRGAKLRRQKDP